MDTALLIVRVVAGALLFGHGTQKLLGWFGGPGIAPMIAHFKADGVRPAAFWAVVGGLTEAGGGMLVALGLLFPLGPLALVAPMIIATLTHAPKGIWLAKGGMEYALTNLTIAVALVFSGAGRFSLDRAFGVAFPEPVVGIVGAALVLLGVATMLAAKDRRPVTATQHEPNTATA